MIQIDFETLSNVYVDKASLLIFNDLVAKVDFFNRFIKFFPFFFEKLEFEGLPLNSDVSTFDFLYGLQNLKAYFFKQLMFVFFFFSFFFMVLLLIFDFNN